MILSCGVWVPLSLALFASGVRLPLDKLMFPYGVWLPLNLALFSNGVWLPLIKLMFSNRVWLPLNLAFFVQMGWAASEPCDILMWGLTASHLSAIVNFGLGAVPVTSCLSLVSAL